MKEEKMFTLTAEEMAEKVDKLDLVGIANALESLYYTIDAIMTEYFYRYDAQKDEDRTAILYEYTRTRALMLAVNTLICDAHKQMEDLQVDVY